jgi:hypothetical protein
VDIFGARALSRGNEKAQRRTHDTNARFHRIKTKGDIGAILRQFCARRHEMPGSRYAVS